MARLIAIELNPLAAGMTLRIKYNFFVIVIYKKTKCTLQNCIMKDKSSALTAGSIDRLIENPSNIAAIKIINILYKRVVKNVLDCLKKRDKSNREKQNALANSSNQSKHPSQQQRIKQQ